MELISRADAIKDAESWVAVDEHERHLQKNVIEWLKEFPTAELGTNLAEVGTDCISREQAIDALAEALNPHLVKFVRAKNAIEQLPPAQPKRGAIEQIKWERDVAIEQLKKLGYGLGEKIRAEKDCISRQAALDIFDDYNVAVENGQIEAYSRDRKRLCELPPAQPEPHWIPVEQDTPTEDDDYWCTFDAETGRFVDWCSWYKGQWVVWINDSPNPVSNVIAWCKPMEPYKEVTE